MFFGTLGKRPILDAPLNTSTANQSVNASSYPYLATFKGSLNHNPTYSEYGEAQLRTTSWAYTGVRYSNLGSAIWNELNTNSGFVSTFLCFLNESFGSSGGQVIDQNYTGYYDGSVYWSVGQSMSCNNSGAYNQQVYVTSPINNFRTGTGVTTHTWYKAGVSGSKTRAISYLDGTLAITNATGKTNGYTPTYTYDGIGCVGPGGINPISVGIIRRKNVLKFLVRLNQGDFDILAANNGRINY